MTSALALDPQLTAAVAGSHLNARAGLAASSKDAARAQSQDFEAMFLGSMFQHMFTGINGDGPFGGSTGIGVWRSFLSDEYAKSFAKTGGIGLADHVYRSLLAQQEAKAQ